MPASHLESTDEVLEVVRQPVQILRRVGDLPVSYTHLTLPTSDLV